jgi:hypothetical protein
LKAIATDDTVTCAEYAEKYNLLNTDDWKKLWHITNVRRNSSRGQSSQAEELPM